MDAETLEKGAWGRNLLKVSPPLARPNPTITSNQRCFRRRLIYRLAAVAAMPRFRNFIPSNAIASGDGAISRQMDAAADSSPSAKPKLSMVSQPS